MNDFGFEKFLIFTKLEVTKKRRTWKEKGPDKVYADLSRKITFLVPLAREPSHGIVTHSSQSVAIRTVSKLMVARSRTTEYAEGQPKTD